MVVDFARVDMYDNIAEELKDLTISVLVNNVGVGEMQPRLYQDFTMEVLEQTRNLTGHSTYTMIRLFLPMMVKRNKGAILNISSLASLANLYLIPYAAEKAKINSMSQSLYLENLGKGVTVQAVMFGLVLTPGAAHATARRVPSLDCPLPDVAAEVALKRFGAGATGIIVPYWFHYVQSLLLGLIPSFLAKYAIVSTFNNLKATWERELKNE